MEGRWRRKGDEERREGRENYLRKGKGWSRGGRGWRGGRGGRGGQERRGGGRRWESGEGGGRKGGEGG